MFQLKYKADRRTVLYMVVISGLFAAQLALGEPVWYLYVPFLFLSVAVAVMAHNHNHVPMWESETLNRLTDYWITVFYGFPVFAWIPTHNHNHHKYTNKPGDHTITYRFWEANNLWTLLTYPTISGWYQQKPVREYLGQQRTKNPSRFRHYLTQYVVLAVWTLGWLLAGGLLFNDWMLGVWFVIIPQQVSLFSVLIFNYVQHVHADEESQYNHSRNITGWMLNAFLFNNGYHTAHHLSPGTHWSKLAEKHAKIADKIDPALNETSFWWYILRAYVLGLVIPPLRTKSMRLQRLTTQGA